MVNPDSDPVIPASTPLEEWVADLAQRNGAPGGGAAAGVMLGVAAGLLGMVAEYSTKDERAAGSAIRLARHRRAALRAAEADGAASVEFGAALALPRDAQDRDGRLAEAATDAARSSLVLGEIGTGILVELELLVDASDPQMSADLAVAAQALAAGVAGASINLRANLQTARKHGGGADADLERGGRELAHARSKITEIAARQDADIAS